jgi:hypothetical protein
MVGLLDDLDVGEIIEFNKSNVDCEDQVANMGTNYGEIHDDIGVDIDNVGYTALDHIQNNIFLNKIITANAWTWLTGTHSGTTSKNRAELC